LGFESHSCSLEQLPDVEEPCVISCLGPAATRFAARGSQYNTVIICDEDNRDVLACLAPTISLPTSYGRIQSALDKVLRLQTAQLAAAAT